eukprot:2327082-Rhodomonas_salina.1
MEGGFETKKRGRAGGREGTGVTGGKSGELLTPAEWVESLVRGKTKQGSESREAFLREAASLPAV